MNKLVQAQVTAVIPAYNEAQTISSVIDPLMLSPWVSSVLVVSDGSTDKTAENARKAGAMVHERAEKGGKGQAILDALTCVQTPYVLLCDADLRGFTKEHVERLVKPVLEGECKMNVGLRDRGWVLTQISRHLPLISGERVLPKEILEQISPTFLQGFMIESALNYYCRSNSFKYGSVVLKGLSIKRKYEKVGYRRAVLQYVHMFYQVIKAMVLVRIARLRGTF